LTKLLVISDDGVPSGYGRISASINRRLTQRGYNVMAASLAYDGLLPPQYDGERLPYWVASLAGRDWVAEVLKIIPTFNPDVILVIQDAPFVEALRNAPIDWSQHALIAISPVDGAPLYPRWVNLMKSADAALTISQFGVEAYREAGVKVDLCRPGVDANRFFPLPGAERIQLRERLGIKPDAFVLGSFCMNQGRKSIPHMLEGFFRFAADKPDARYLLDMDAISPAGWDIRAMCDQFGWDAGKLIFRADAVRAGLTEMRDRYNMLDAHAVLSHREGFGLPLVEAMACGVVSIALDYCSGAEICGNGRGVLVKPLAYQSVSTWGNAYDRHPDLDDFVAKLEWLRDSPHERFALTMWGMEWARTLTWDSAADAVQRAIERVLAKRSSNLAVSPNTHAVINQQRAESAPNAQHHADAKQVPLSVYGEGLGEG
jgi:glycosyltransferase involved in cell wall biosynthesis